MNLGVLITACRIRSDDNAAKKNLWSDEEWTLYLNEAQNEACIRADLLTGDEMEITAEGGVTRYDLPKNVLDVQSIKVFGKPLFGWDLTATALVLEKPLLAGFVMVLIISRLPKPLKDANDIPEINPMLHYRLIDWALRCAYLKADTDTLNKGAAGEHEAAFIRSFGEYRDANVQRKQRSKAPRTVRPIAF